MPCAVTGDEGPGPERDIGRLIDLPKGPPRDPTCMRPSKPSSRPSPTLLQEALLETLQDGGRKELEDELVDGWRS